MLNKIIILIFILFVVSASVYADTYTLTSTLPGGESSVDTSDVGSYLSWLFNFLLGIISVLAVIVIVIGGLKYIGAAGNPEVIKDAKGQIWGAIAGLLLALVSWLILNSISPQFTEFKINWYTGGTSSSGGGTGGGGTGGGETGGEEAGGGGETETKNWGEGSSDVTYNSVEARQLLADNNISVNKNECSMGQTSGCTSLAGVRQNTLYGALNLKAECPSCEIVITGGTEPGHESGDKSHAEGYKLDLRQTTSLNSYIENNFTEVGYRKGEHGGKIYENKQTGVRVVKEHDHWDAYGWEIDKSQ